MVGEVVFHCSNGVASDSICLGDDPYKILRPIAQSGQGREPNGFQLCGFLQKPAWRGTTIFDYVEQYEAQHLHLLNFYIGRSLSYDFDVLNAFSGIINAQAHSLGQFEAGMPLRLFARALFLSIPPESGPLSRRRGFPSWSWIGWKIELYSPLTRLDNGGELRGGPIRPRVYWTLVQIYSSSGSGTPVLLLGPYDFDNGIEGYCTRSIELYNRLIHALPLPTEPCVSNVPELQASSEERASPLLVFWTHIARLNLSTLLEKSVASEVHIDCPKIRARLEEEASVELEVVLIAITRRWFSSERGLAASFNADTSHLSYRGSSHWKEVKPPWEHEDGGHELSGIIIERWRGLARRVGVVQGISIQQWIAANPQKELLLLA
jgi:hypothetical protein